MLYNQNEQKEIFSSLLYLNIRELKNICIHFGLSTKNEKIKLIENIQTYLSTGIKPQEKVIPAISKAQPKIKYPLALDTYILKGSFKNDLKTRIFLKTLIGNHFHYTAYGIDWIKDNWMQGTPPTYEQFATYWQKEYELRTINKAALKPEWAYLNFLDHYKKNHAGATKSQAVTAWKIERESHVEKIKNLLHINFNSTKTPRKIFMF